MRKKYNEHNLKKHRLKNFSSIYILMFAVSLALGTFFENIAQNNTQLFTKNLSGY